MGLANTRATYQQKAPVIQSGVVPYKSLYEKLRLTERPRMVSGPFPAQVSNETFEVALLVFPWNASALHRARGAVFHGAIACHRNVAPCAVFSRHQLPSGSSAQRAIFKSHVYVVGFQREPVPAKQT